MRLTTRALRTLRRRLLGWYRANRRDLPWRRAHDAYRIWLAEVMLQQTRMQAVLPYYRRFLRRFPTVQALARARREEVLELWAGLGYYRRARNVHAAAKEIVARHKGRFPRELAAARALPGVGRYTAAAVVSIAYGAPLAALDGNVARVVARLDALRGDLRAPRRWRRLEQAAQELLAAGATGEWNQAMMELGERVCTPRSPRCQDCPISQWCRAYALGLANKIPAPRKKRAPVNMRIAAAVLLDPQGRTLLVRDPGRHEDAPFSRMWQFPAAEITNDSAAELSDHLGQSLGIRAEPLVALPSARHSVTFREITLLPFLVRVVRLPKGPGVRTARLEELARLPVSSATRKIASAALQSR